MQHLQRGPERVHFCKRNKTKSCHRYRNQTHQKYNKASLFVITIISTDHLCSLCHPFDSQQAYSGSYKELMP